MNKKFCDNCRKEIRENEYIEGVGSGKLEINMVNKIKNLTDEIYPPFIKKLDLCPECCNKMFKLKSE